MTPPKMPIHIGDYKRDTGHLRAAEHGAYLLLLFHHWATGSLPNDDRQLAAIACMSQPEWKRTKPILEKFFKEGWRHGRIERDLAEANEAYERRARAGEKGGKAKAGGKQCSSNATADIEQCSSNRLPITNKEDRIVDGRASASAFTEGSKALATALWKALDYETPLQVPLELAGIDWRATAWEAAGWTVDLIEAEAKKIGRGKPLTYYEKCFATAFAKRQAPLPVVEIKEAEKLTVMTNGNSKNSRGGSLIDALDRRIAEAELAEKSDLALPAGAVLSLPNRSIR